MALLKTKGSATKSRTKVEKKMEHDEVLVSNGKDGLQSVKELETRYKSVCFLQSVIKVYDIHKKTNKEKIK